MKLTLVATTAFGLEAVVKREIEKLEYKILKVEDGRIIFLGDERAIVRTNLWLRSADRVQILMGDFKAGTFEELFQQIKAIKWHEIIPLDGAFPVEATSVKSTLTSLPAIQRTAKKAVVLSLEDFFNVPLTETRGTYKIKISLVKDRCFVTLDTSGAGLHKRGYRVKQGKAPMKETLAAALVQLSFWNKDRVLLDPCCGSATIPIEAAMIGRNIAPGLGRNFAFESWDIISEELIRSEKRQASEKADFSIPLKIFARDIDASMVKIAMTNADEVGLLEDINIKKADMTKGIILPSNIEAEDVVMICNPPYGERIGDKEILKNTIYNSLANTLKLHDNWSLFLITSQRDIEKVIKKGGADRRRKLYNGNYETCFFQYYGRRQGKKQS